MVMSILTLLKNTWTLWIKKEWIHTQWNVYQTCNGLCGHSITFGFYITPPPILLALGLALNPPPTLRFSAPIWSLGYGTWVVSFLFIEPSTSVPLQLVYVIRKKFLGKWNKFRWLRKKNVSFCNMLFTSTINIYQNNKHWMLSLTLIKPVWALPFPFQWVVPSSMVQLFLSWINNYSLKMQQQRISPSIAE